MNQSSWMSLGEAAGLLGVHPSTLRIWADRGEVPSHRTPGGHRRFRREELSAWSAAHGAGQIDKAHSLLQSVLNRTRLQSTEGRFEGEAWYRRLSENGKGRLRELGQRTLVALAQSPGSLRPEGETNLITLGQQYGELLNAEGLALEEGLRAFLQFRAIVLDSALELLPTSKLDSPTSWGQLYRQVTHSTDVLLLAMVEHMHPPEPQG
ncbi:MAG: helix-turn-helix domain-containing protein [Anaerolineales bacterium]